MGNSLASTSSIIASGCFRASSADPTGGVLNAEIEAAETFIASDRLSSLANNLPSSHKPLPRPRQETINAIIVWSALASSNATIRLQFLK
jgi:hypothetical protein